jgi:Flp pilus assembly protein TadD
VSIGARARLPGLLGCAVWLVAALAPVLQGCAGQRAEPPSQTEAPEDHTPSPDSVSSLIEQARALARDRKRESLLESATLFERATRMAPRDAAAWSGLADCHALIGLYSHRPAAESLALALPAAERALELIDQDDSAEPATRARTLASLGLARFLWSHDFAAAEDAFEQALTIADSQLATTDQQQDFDLPQTLHWYAMLLHATGRHAEAIVRITRAAELSPQSSLLQTKLATVLIGAGYLDQAQAQLDLHRDRFPSFAMLHRELGNVALARRQFDRAIEHFSRAIELNPRDHRSVALRAQAQALSGGTEEARLALNDLQSNDSNGEGPVSELSVALVQAGLGETDAAMATLERARQKHEAGIVYINSRPGFDLLHQVEGWPELMKELGLS